jgi:PTH1 family peptidyl-tRNA hydrolase
VADYVLRKPPASEREAIVTAVERSVLELDALLAGDMVRATRALHAPPPRPAQTQSPRERAVAPPAQAPAGVKPAEPSSP